MDVIESIRQMANNYAETLKRQIEVRTLEMQADNRSHYLIYKVLGVSCDEGEAIDLHQNKGRFLYKYAGSFLEAAVKECFKSSFPDAASIKLINTLGVRPKTFEVDCLVQGRAYEIKWKDATTDGDHTIKEHNRLKVIEMAGYRPMRLMFFYPNRNQAQRIQAVLADLYKASNGIYLHGEQAWNHVFEETGVDLKSVLEQIASEREI